jgi:hypothetical protein
MGDRPEPAYPRNRPAGRHHHRRIEIRDFTSIGSGGKIAFISAAIGWLSLRSMADIILWSLVKQDFRIF